METTIIQVNPDGQEISDYWGNPIRTVSVLYYFQIERTDETIEKVIAGDPYSRTQPVNLWVDRWGSKYYKPPVVDYGGSGGFVKVDATGPESRWYEQPRERVRYVIGGAPVKAEWLRTHQFGPPFPA